MIIDIRGVIAAGMLLATVPASARTYFANAATLQSVFAGAKAGDIIRLRGSFGVTALRDRTFATALTIDARSASFTDTFLLSGVSGINLVGGRYGQSTRTMRYNTGIKVYGSNRVSISSPIVGGIADGHGIDFASSTTVSVTGGTFTGLRAGVTMIAVNGGTLTRNRSIAASSDGFDIADSHNIKISHNSCSGGVLSPGAHPDCVQLWSIRGNAPQSDIEVSDNIATGPTQGFTSFNGSDGGGIRFKFLRNRVDTSFPQGIACYECRDSVFAGNILTTLPGSRFRTSLNIVGGRNNIIRDNSIGARPNLNATFDAGDVTLAFDAPAANFADFDTAATAAPRFDSFDGGLAAPTAVSLAAGLAVPEPATWALLIAGFGMTGLAVRRRRARLA